MDALLYYDFYDPIPLPWYQCCGCASSDVPVAGCQCVCHEIQPDYDDDDFQTCPDCLGRGTIAFDEMGEFLGERADDLDDIDVCPTCGGSGVIGAEEYDDEEDDPLTDMEAA